MNRILNGHTFLLFSLFFAQHALSQNPRKMDSLNLLLQQAKDDTTRLRIYLRLGEECETKDNLKYADPAIRLANQLLSKNTDPDFVKKTLKKKADAINLRSVFFQDMRDTANWIKSQQEILSINKQIQDTSAVIEGILRLGEYNQTIGNLPRALEYYQEGFAFSKQMKDKKIPIRFLRRIGNMYADQGDATQAEEFYDKCFSLAKEVRDTNFLSGLYLFKGYLYSQLLNPAKEFECYNKSLALYSKIKNPRGIAEAYRNIGDAYKRNKDYANALLNYKKGLSIIEPLNNKDGIYGAFIILDRISNTYRLSGDYKNAMDYILRGQKLAENNKAPEFLQYAYFSLAQLYRARKDFKKMKYYADRSLSLVNQSIDAGDKKDGEELAAIADSACGNYKEAYFHYQKYVALRRKFESEEVRKHALQTKFRKEYDDKKAADKAEQGRKDIINAAERKRQVIITWSVIGGLLSALVFAIFILRSLRITRKQKQLIEVQSQETARQKHLVEEKQKEIIDSIAYAKRLQNAILPATDEILKSLPKSFLLYLPKDIVAGDFYWMEDVGDSIYIAAADCTGHGVPGAMVSVVCSNALGRAVKEFGLRNTGEILDKVRDLVIETFEKSDKEVKDGMDISLLRIFKKGTGKIQWSGANNPLWFFHEGRIEEIRASKQPIGKYSEPAPFTTHELAFPSSINFYLFSDGYADQFSPDDKKLMKKHFRELLISIQDKPMFEQKEFLDNYIKNWRGTTEQTDDILVIGVRV